MTVSIREAQPSDAAECGRIIAAAFAAIADEHKFARDFPSAEIALGLAEMLIASPGYYGVVADEDGRVLGSNFLDERSIVGGVGPISVDPAVQNRGVGRRLMEAVLTRAAAQQMPGVRLVQDAFHNRSLCLYTSLGFATREPLSVLQGRPFDLRLPGYEIRPATPEDAAACETLCSRVHGFPRAGEVASAVARGNAVVVEHLGQVTGYTTEIGFFGHAVGQSNADLRALIGAAPRFAGPGFLVPTRNHDLLQWCLARGLRLVKQMTLMTTGLYNEPQGAYLPSVLY